MAGKELRELNWLYDLAYNVVNNANKEYTDNAYKYVKQKLEELTKYKRAFEILNLNFTLICKEDEYLCNKKYYLLSDTYTEIEKEEAELLEELMNGEI